MERKKKVIYDHIIEISDNKVLRAWDLQGREVKPMVKTVKHSPMWTSGVGTNYRTFTSRLKIGMAKYDPINE